MRYRPKTKPYSHQTRATLRAVKQRNHAFYMVPRAGKTKAALDAVGILAMKYPGLKVLVVCPLSALSVWDEEIQKHYPHFAMIEDHEHEWEYPGATDYITHFYLINYDRLRYRSREKGKWVYPYIHQVEREFRPEVIILDESHRAKRAGAVTSQALWRLVRRMRKRTTDGRPWVFLLTGTPNPKSYVDIFAQYRIMDSDIFGTAVATFEDEFVEYGTGYARYRIVKYRNKSLLLRKIRSRATFVGEKDLPPMPKQWQNHRVTLPHNARELYDSLAEELVAEWEDKVLEADNAGVRALRLRQIVGGFTTDGTEIHREKVRTAVDLIGDLQAQGQPVVVYARFLSEVAALEKALGGVDIDVASVTGSTHPDDRAALRRDFTAGRLSVLVYQVSVGSLAIDLSVANEVLYYSLPDSWLDYYQSSKRCDQIGKKTPVRVHHLVCPGTIDLSILRGLRDKADLQAELMKDVRAFLFGV